MPFLSKTTKKTFTDKVHLKLPKMCELSFKLGNKDEKKGLWAFYVCFYEALCVAYFDF